MFSKQRLEAAFKMFDKDESGSVDLDEFKEMFSGINVSEEVWKEMIKECDADNNGTISFEEFTNMLMNQIEVEE